MTTKEYVKTAQKARALLLEAYVEFVDGDDHLKGSETLWGAVALATQAVSRARRWRLGSHGRLQENADRLSTELSEQDIADDFQVAEKFHTNFYHDYLEDFRISRDRPLVHRFVSRVLAPPELGGGTA